MLFGEIVEPSTRALIDEDSTEFPEYVEDFLEWSGNFSLPDKPYNLVIIESNKINKLFKKVAIGANNIAKTSNTEIELLKCNDSYIITLQKKSMFTFGEIVLQLKDWIEKAANIYAITSEPIATYQNKINNKPESFIKCLNLNQTCLGYEKLESPNLVTGLGACVLDYCIHKGLKCTLFIVYMDASPIDSVNSNPFVQLLQKLQLSVAPWKTEVLVPSSNLYT